MTRRSVLEFWYEFASTYSYLTAMRIEPLAEAAGVDIRWRPFLLGPIFAAQGWTSSPFNLFPAKGRYMWRDMERQAAALGVPFRKPDPFPQNALLAARGSPVRFGAAEQAQRPRALGRGSVEARILDQALRLSGVRGCGLIVVAPAHLLVSISRSFRRGTGTAAPGRPACLAACVF